MRRLQDHAPYQQNINKQSLSRDEPILLFFSPIFLSGNSFF